MSDYRPLTRSRSKRAKAETSTAESSNQLYVPPPLNIRKANASRTPENRGHDTSFIGIAVGSPSDSPLPPLPPSQPDHYNVFSFPQNTTEGPRTVTDGGEQGNKERKSKGTRWRNIGAFFGKKEAQNRSGEHLVNGSDAGTRKDRQCGQNKPEPGTRKRAGSDKEKGMELHNALASKPIVKGTGLLRRASTKRQGIRKQSPGGSRVQEPRPRMSPASNALGQNPPGRMQGGREQTAHLRPHNDYNLLQVDIPNVELERYSVMFGNVLKPGSNAASKTSLLLTKPGIAEDWSDTPLNEPPRLEHLTDHHARKGSASSASSKAPSFSLFPPSSSPCRMIVNKPLPKPSPLGRSVTEPISSPPPPPRPPLKAIQSQDTHQHLTVAPGKENLPASQRRTPHSRDVCQPSTHPRNHSFEPKTSTNHAISHSRNHSFDPSVRSRSSLHRPKLSFDYSYHSAASPGHQSSFEFSVRSPNDTHGSCFETSSFAPLSPPPSPLADNPSEHAPSVPEKNTPTTPTDNSKHAFLNRAFPARKSSLKRLKADRRHPSTPDHDLPEPPKPPYGNEGVEHQSSESVSSAAEVSIARQVSISRRQRQLLVPVVQKTARQPMQPLFMNGEGRKSEMVFFETASPTQSEYA